MSANLAALGKSGCMKQEAKAAAGGPATLWDRTRQLASREILDTALRLFTEQGYDETTIAQIAREAGVFSAPSFATSEPRRSCSAAIRSGSAGS